MGRSKVLFSAANPWTRHLACIHWAPDPRVNYPNRRPNTPANVIVLIGTYGQGTGNAILIPVVQPDVFKMAPAAILGFTKTDAISSLFDQISPIFVGMLWLWITTHPLISFEKFCICQHLLTVGIQMRAYYIWIFTLRKMVVRLKKKKNISEKQHNYYRYEPAKRPLSVKSPYMLQWHDWIPMHAVHKFQSEI